MQKKQLENSLKQDEAHLTNGRNQAAQIRNRGEDYNPHGLGFEINESIPEAIEYKQRAIQLIQEELGPLLGKFTE